MIEPSAASPASQSTKPRLYSEAVSATLELPVLDETGKPSHDEAGAPRRTVHPIEIAIVYEMRRLADGDYVKTGVYEIALNCPRRMDSLVHFALQNLSIKISRALQRRDPETGDPLPAEAGA